MGYLGLLAVCLTHFVWVRDSGFLNFGNIPALIFVFVIGILVRKILTKVQIIMVRVIIIPRLLGTRMKTSYSKNYG